MTRHIIGEAWRGEHFVLDLRDDSSPVYLLDITSASRDDAIIQAADVAQFVAALDAGTFTTQRGQ